LKTVSPTLGPKDTFKIIVFSHERSGTHFLMNTIADNFGYVSDPWLDIDDDTVTNPYAAENIQSFLENYKDLPMLNLIKTHYPAEFFGGIEDWLLDNFVCFYIRREPEACLKSLRRHVEDLPWKSGPLTPTDEVFRWSKPCGGMLKYQLNQYDHIWQRHAAHVLSYTTIAPWQNGMIHLTYEDLDQRFDDTVAEIGRRMQLLPLHRPAKRPDRNLRVVKADHIHEEFNEHFNKEEQAP
jgi:hypothetical protein